MFSFELLPGYDLHIEPIHCLVLLGVAECFVCSGIQHRLCLLRLGKLCTVIKQIITGCWQVAITSKDAHLPSFTNQALSSALSLTSAVLAVISLLTSMTLPETGEYTSDAAFTDSTLANDSLQITAISKWSSPEHRILVMQRSETRDKMQPRKP
jgi:hypothetical protein